MDTNIVQKEREYKFRSRRLNPDFQVLSLRACHIHNNAGIVTPEILIKKSPKWLTVLDVQEADTATGEISYSIYETDDIKAASNRKIKIVKRFSEFYEPLYQDRKVSLLFFTFTRLQFSVTDMRRMLDIVKYRFNQLDRKVRGYLWCLEVSTNNHVHYHLVVAVDRVYFKRIPSVLKLDDVWGQMTSVEFIKKSVKSYLGKYLYKNEGGVVMRRRAYSISRKLE